MADDFLDAARAGDLPWLQETNWRPYEMCSDERGVTAYHYAAANNHAETLEYLLKDIEKRSTPATMDRFFSKIINVQNVDGNTPMHWACLNGAKDTVRCLLARKADLLVFFSSFLSLFNRYCLPLLTWADEGRMRRSRTRLDRPPCITQRWPTSPISLN